MKASMHRVVFLFILFGFLYCLYLLYQSPGVFSTEEEKLQNYMSAAYKEWFVVNAVGVIDIYGKGLNGVTYYKGYFAGEPETTIVVDIMGNNSFSKYYLSVKEVPGKRSETLENLVNRYFDSSVSDVQLTKNMKYVVFEPSMTFDEGIDYMLDMGEVLNFNGSVKVDTGAMTKREFEDMCKILYSDLEAEGCYFNLIIEGNLSSKEYARAIMTKQKYLPKKDNRVNFEYVY